MADPFLAEIRMFPFNFAPVGWAFCDGQLMYIQQNTALFSLISFNFGGDGKTTFALPDLRGRAPMHPGQGPGLTRRDFARSGGTEEMTLSQTEMPAHSHALLAAIDPADLNTPSPARSLALSTGEYLYNPGPADTQLDPSALSNTGGGAAHNNMMPYLPLHFCIAVTGYYPSRD